jgi:hypothetical protein
MGCLQNPAFDDTTRAASEDLHSKIQSTVSLQPMSEPLLPLQTFGNTAGNSEDESAVPFIRRKKQPKPA